MIPSTCLGAPPEQAPLRYASLSWDRATKYFQLLVFMRRMLKVHVSWRVTTERNLAGRRHRSAMLMLRPWRPPCAGLTRRADAAKCLGATTQDASRVHFDCPPNGRLKANYFNIVSTVVALAWYSGTTRVRAGVRGCTGAFASDTPRSSRFARCRHDMRNVYIAARQASHPWFT
jgi:hypothetical protein